MPDILQDNREEISADDLIGKFRERVTNPDPEYDKDRMVFYRLQGWASTKENVTQAGIIGRLFTEYPELRRKYRIKGLEMTTASDADDTPAPPPTTALPPEPAATPAAQPAAPAQPGWWDRPLIKPPEIPEPGPEVSKPELFIGGMAEGLTRGLAHLTTPRMAATIGGITAGSMIPGIGALIGGGAGLYFTYEMAKGLIDSIPEAKKAAQEGDWRTLGNIIGQDALMAYFTKKAGGHTLRRAKTLYEKVARPATAKQQQHVTQPPPSVQQQRPAAPSRPAGSELSPTAEPTTARAAEPQSAPAAQTQASPNARLVDALRREAESNPKLRKVTAERILNIIRSDPSHPQHAEAISATNKQQAARIANGVLGELVRDRAINSQGELMPATTPPPGLYGFDPQWTPEQKAFWASQQEFGPLAVPRSGTIPRTAPPPTPVEVETPASAPAAPAPATPAEPVVPRPVVRRTKAAAAPQAPAAEPAAPTAEPGALQVPRVGPPAATPAQPTPVPTPKRRASARPAPTPKQQAAAPTPAVGDAAVGSEPPFRVATGIIRPLGLTPDGKQVRYHFTPSNPEYGPAEHSVSVEDWAAMLRQAQPLEAPIPEVAPPKRARSRKAVMPTPKVAPTPPTEAQPLETPPAPTPTPTPTRRRRTKAEPQQQQPASEPPPAKPVPNAQQQPAGEWLVTRLRQAAGLEPAPEPIRPVPEPIRPVPEPIGPTPPPTTTPAARKSARRTSPPTAGQRMTLEQRLRQASEEANKRLRDKGVLGGEQMGALTFLDPATARDFAISIAWDVARGAMTVRDVARRLGTVVGRMGPDVMASARRLYQHSEDYIRSLGLAVEPHRQGAASEPPGSTPRAGSDLPAAPPIAETFANRIAELERRIAQIESPQERARAEATARELKKRAAAETERVRKEAAKPDVSLGMRQWQERLQAIEGELSRLLGRPVATRPGAGELTATERARIEELAQEKRRLDAEIAERERLLRRPQPQLDKEWKEWEQRQAELPPEERDAARIPSALRVGGRQNVEAQKRRERERNAARAAEKAEQLKQQLEENRLVAAESRLEQELQREQRMRDTIAKIRERQAREAEQRQAELAAAQARPRATKRQTEAPPQKSPKRIPYPEKGKELGAISDAFLEAGFRERLGVQRRPLVKNDQGQTLVKAYEVWIKPVEDGLIEVQYNPYEGHVFEAQKHFVGRNRKQTTRVLHRASLTNAGTKPLIDFLNRVMAERPIRPSQ